MILEEAQKGPTFLYILGLWLGLDQLCFHYAIYSLMLMTYAYFLCPHR